MFGHLAVGLFSSGSLSCSILCVRGCLKVRKVLSLVPSLLSLLSLYKAILNCLYVSEFMCVSVCVQGCVRACVCACVRVCDVHLDQPSPTIPMSPPQTRMPFTYLGVRSVLPVVQMS